MSNVIYIEDYLKKKREEEWEDFLLDLIEEVESLEIE